MTHYDKFISFRFFLSLPRVKNRIFKASHISILAELEYFKFFLKKYDDQVQWVTLKLSFS